LRLIDSPAKVTLPQKKEEGNSEIGIIYKGDLMNSDFTEGGI